MSRQSRNSKRALSSSQVSHDTTSPKVSRLAATSNAISPKLYPSSPNKSITTVAEFTNTSVSQSQVKRLYYFILDLALSYEKIYLQKLSDSEHSDVTNKLNLYISSDDIDGVQLFIQQFIDVLSHHISNTNSMISFLKFLNTYLCAQNPSKEFMTGLLAELINQIGALSESGHPLLPQMPPNSDRLQGLTLNEIKMRVVNNSYIAAWSMLLDVIIATDDIINYYSNNVPTQDLDSLSNTVKFYMHKLYNSQNSLAAIELNSNTSPSSKPIINDACKEDTLPADMSEESTAASYKIIEQLYKFISTSKDEKNNVYDEYFKDTPTKESNPEYHNKIKKLVDLTVMRSRIASHVYTHYNDFLHDVQQMCSNATLFHDQTHYIHTMSLNLLKHLFAHLDTLCETRVDIYPNAVDWLNNTILQLFTYVLTYDTSDELGYGSLLCSIKWKTRGNIYSRDLNTMKKDIEQGKYTRLDKFQKDLFFIFKRTRETSSPGSQEYTASVETQRAYILKRNELCKNILSQAMSFDLAELDEELKSVSRSAKWTLVLKDSNPPSCSSSPTKQKQACASNIKIVAVDSSWVPSSTDGYESTDECTDKTRHVISTFTRQDVAYSVGDSVYIESRDIQRASSKPHIISISSIWQTPTGEVWVFGMWFYRPEETYHLATKKFYEHEIFKTDHYQMARATRVIGICYVMHIKSYIKFHPEGFKNEDVYVCQSKYNIKNKSERKIKVWSLDSRDIKLLPRDTPVQLNRVPSVFAMAPPSTVCRDDNKSDPELDSLATGDDLASEDDADYEDVNVPLAFNQGSGSRQRDYIIYYEQFVLNGVRYKLGDFVYTNTHDKKKFLSRIDAIWVDEYEEPQYSGPWLYLPANTIHPPTQLFYKKEVIMNSENNINPMRLITGRCCVMSLKDYCQSRPTEFSEDDIYVCVYKYFEKGDHKFKRIKAFKPFLLSTNICKDEVLTFSEKIRPHLHLSPFLDDYLAGKKRPSSIPLTPPSTTSIPVRKILPTHGYGIFCSINRSKFQVSNPNLTVPLLTKLLAREWRSLTAEDKAVYEKMASEKNALIENIKSAPGAMVVYECCWKTCDYQFENVQDLYNHLKSKITEASSPCLWVNCHKHAVEFTSNSKLLKHVKEAHIRTSSKLILPSEKTANFVPSFYNENTNSFARSSSSNSHLTPHLTNFNRSISSQLSSLTGNSAPQVDPPLGTQTILQGIYSSLDYTLEQCGHQISAQEFLPNDLKNAPIYENYISSLYRPCTEPINDLSQVDAKLEQPITDHYSDYDVTTNIQGYSEDSNLEVTQSREINDLTSLKNYINYIHYYGDK